MKLEYDSKTNKYVEQAVPFLDKILKMDIMDLFETLNKNRLQLSISLRDNDFSVDISPY